MISTAVEPGIKAIKNGGLIAYPTEGVWGLGCDPFEQAAVERLLQVKHRKVDKGLILVASSIEQILPLLNKLPVSQRELIETACPGPDTWLIPDPDQFIPAWIKGKFDTVAIRVSLHPVVIELCNEFGLIVSTSANPEGLPPAKNEAKVREYFSTEFESSANCIVSGSLGSQFGPSKIRDLQSYKVLRE